MQQDFYDQNHIFFCCQGCWMPKVKYISAAANDFWLKKHIENVLESTYSHSLYHEDIFGIFLLYFLALFKNIFHI